MHVEILHNTTHENGRMVIISRPIDDGPVTRPGDILTLVGTIDVPDTISAQDAADLAFAAGNRSDQGDGPTEVHHSWRVRSLSIGDVVRVHTSIGTRTLVCTPTGWAPILVDRHMSVTYSVADVSHRSRLDIGGVLEETGTGPTSSQVSNAKVAQQLVRDFPQAGGALDDVVHDHASLVGTDVNNNGPYAQIVYLLNQGEPVTAIRTMLAG
jgi:hypothetical protein